MYFASLTTKIANLTFAALGVWTLQPSKTNGCGSSTEDPKMVVPTKCCNSLGSYRTLPRTKIANSRYAAQSVWSLQLDSRESEVLTGS